MIVGVCKISLHLYDADSLKSKRMVVSRLKDRIKNKFNVAIAEVEDQDLWQKSVLGIVTISTSVRHVDSMIDHVLNFIEKESACEIIDIERYVN